MNLDQYVAVSGLPGLYKVVTNKENGLIIEDLDTGKVKFASSRQYQFTPLSSISIYVDGDVDSIDIATIFKTMKAKAPNRPVVDAAAEKEEIMEYFGKILPNYDKERVYPSHIRKLLKWYKFLDAKELLNTDDKPIKSTASEEE